MRKIVCYIAVGVGLALAGMLGLQYQKQVWLQQEIAGKILRFHVLANSDTKEDQKLKLQIRDAVGAKMGEWLKVAESRAECEVIVKKHLTEVADMAEDMAKEAGYDYPVEAFLQEVEFPVKTYGNYTFPPGRYEALNLVIGEGEGHNWWCVMYPNMCFSGTMYEVNEEENEEALREVLTEEEYEKVLSSGDYEVRFKYLSFLNE